MNRLLWNFNYWIILFLILISCNYNIINWVNNINNCLIIVWFVLIYLLLFNNMNVRLAFVNANDFIFDGLINKKNGYLLMKIAETLLKKGMKKKNNLFDNNKKQKRYSSTNDTKKNLQKDINKQIQEFYQNNKEKQYELMNVMKITFKHPSISDIGKTNIIESENNELKGKTEVLMIFTSTKPDNVNIENNIMEKEQVLFKEKDGKDAYIGKMQWEIDVDSIKLQKGLYFENDTKFKGEYTIEESNKFIEKNNELVNKNDMKNFNINNGEITNNAKKFSEVEDNFTFKKKIDDSIEDGINNWKD